MIAPCYIIQGERSMISVLGLSKSKSGDCIKRSCRLDDTGSTGHSVDIPMLTGGVLIQTNTDHNVVRVDPLWAAGDELLLNSVERKVVMKKEMTKLLPNNGELTVDNCISAMSVEPVFNRQTIYTVIYGFDIETNECFYDAIRYCD